MILTNEEIKRIGEGNTGSWQDDLMFARAIESAVLEKLKSQEPVAWARFDEDDDNRLCGVLDFENPPLYVTPLYLQPLPPDDVVQKYEELLYAVHRKFPNETRHQTALRYIKTAESSVCIDATMKERK